MASGTAGPLVFVGDDFTGATDTLATLARAGLRVRLIPARAFAALGAAAAEVLGPLDAVGIATDLRAMPPVEAEAAVARLLPGLAALAPRLLHLKVCSTFDSSPGIGNIHTAARALRDGLGIGRTVILGGQPSLRRYCLFGTLFAAAGDGHVYRIDRHPVMRRHPVTPMAEADLRLHLAAQGWQGIDLVAYPDLEAGAEALTRQLGARFAAGDHSLLIDIARGADLAALGPALAALSAEAPLLCIGASSVAEAMLHARPAPPAERRPAAPAFDGPILALAGSRSEVTARQVAATTAYERVLLPPAAFAAGAEDLLSRCAGVLADGRNLLVAVTEARDAFLFGASLAAAVADFAARLLARVRPGALVVAGGDTSGAVVQALGLRGLVFTADIDRGVPLVQAEAEGPLDGLAMVLKGGQMGGAELFDRLAGFRTPPH